MSTELIACFFAASAFSFLLRQPVKTIPVSGSIATLGYLIFILLSKSVFAYFAATLFISIASEIAARIAKKTATLFLISALIPLIPGVSLYRAMRFAVDGNLTAAGDSGMDTLLAFCAIALGISISSIFFSNIHSSVPKCEKK